MGKNPFTDHHHLPGNYAKELLMFEKGEGVYLEDISGKRYLDFGSGIAVNALGYGREDIAEIAYKQMKKLIHTSNLYTTEPTAVLSDKLTATGNFDAVHFGNSGTEANEAAVKYARLYAYRKKGPGHNKIACFTAGFHGRTMGSLSCTPNRAYQEPFEPLMPGIKVLPFNDINALLRGLDDSFAGVIIEVLQGEGGLDAVSTEFASTLNDLCAKHDIILIADEVQTGLGRTGEFFASSRAGLVPDIITLAKPLAGGLPLSATLIPKKVNDLLQVGDHGSTFGGGPVTAAVASHILDVIFQPAFLQSVKEKGSILYGKLLSLVQQYDALDRVKGRGLLLGVALKETEDVKVIMQNIITEARNEGLLVLRSGKNVVRIAPPLVITEEELDKGVRILEKVFGKVFA